MIFENPVGGGSRNLNYNQIEVHTYQQALKTI